MKRFVKSSFLDDGQVESSNSEDDEVDHGASRAKRKREESSTEDEDISHNRFKKVEVNLKNHVYEPVHFVRAHCKAGEEPDVDTQVSTSLWYFLRQNSSPLKSVFYIAVSRSHNGCFIASEAQLLRIPGLGCRGRAWGKRATCHLWRSFLVRFLHQV